MKAIKITITTGNQWADIELDEAIYDLINKTPASQASFLSKEAEPYFLAMLTQSLEPDS